MREPAQLAMMKRLAAVQRARRLGAEVAMADAAEAETEAQGAEQTALARSRAAHSQWTDYLAEPGFSPEFSRALSDLLIARDDEASAAGREARRREENHVERREEWQRLEAQVRQSDKSVRHLRRKVGRKADERKMAALADRVTYFWSCP